MGPILAGTVLPRMHEALVSILSVTLTRYGGTCLSFCPQELDTGGSVFSYIAIWRLAWATRDPVSMEQERTEKEGKHVESPFWKNIQPLMSRKR